MLEMRTTRSAFTSWPRLALVTALAIAALGVTASAASAMTRVEIVTQGTPPKLTKDQAKYISYYSTIQAAVNASKRHTYILVEPGVYDEEVKIKKPHSDIFLRGMNRNEVILDGQHKSVPGGRNGIEIYKDNDVWVENLTVRNFEREEQAEHPRGSEGANGNEIWWTGGVESHKIGAHGWFGRYLTAYDTGLNGGYGIFAQNETEGLWENIYASGFNDSGIYIGACPECKAKVTKATMEDNALGYSGSNSGGLLIIEDSTFAHNTSGIAPNSEDPGDGPPPSNGECAESHGEKRAAPLKWKKVTVTNEKNEEEKVYKWVGELPEFTSTNIERCEVFRDNVVKENNNLSAPANASAANAPWGVGIELPGTYAMKLEGNEIIDNPTDGVLAFEYPNPYEKGKIDPIENSVFFQNAGNAIIDNKFEGNGSHGGVFSGAIGMEGGIFGTKTSTDNCAEGNTYGNGEATYPENLEGTWNCQNATTPNPVSTFSFIVYLETLSEESEDRPTIESAPAPPPQETMPNPCEGVPANPTCEKYEREH